MVDSGVLGCVQDTLHTAGARKQKASVKAGLLDERVDLPACGLTSATRGSNRPSHANQVFTEPHLLIQPHPSLDSLWQLGGCKKRAEERMVTVLLGQSKTIYMQLETNPY